LNTDSNEVHQPANFEGIEKFSTAMDALHPILSECRVIKSAKELEVMRYVCKVSSHAHVEVMRHCATARPQREYELESVFLHDVYKNGGCRHVSYTCICASGHHSSTLHYGHSGAPNSGPVEGSHILLMDMGAEYHCYGADITCSFPANGVFTEQQKGIYNIVLKAQLAVFHEIKPSVSWPKMHRVAGIIFFFFFQFIQTCLFNLI